MRWRQTFIAEVSQALQQLGLRACPVCGSAEGLGIGRFPAFWLDGGPALGCDDLPLGEDHDYPLTFAIRIECTTCGHLMLFNAEKYRTGWRAWVGDWSANQSWTHIPADSSLRIADDLDALREIIPSELYELVLDAVDQPAVEDLDI